MKELSVFIAYVLIGIFTFGHAYNHYPDTEEASFAGHKYTITNGPGTKTFASCASSLVWPLYWSVKLQEK
jgi:hypothetical protein